MQTDTLPCPVMEPTQLTIDHLTPLFPDDEEGEFINTMDMTRCIYAIRQIEKRIAQLKLQLGEAEEYYRRKVAQHQERIDFLKRNILGFLQQNDMRNIQTPCGTAYQKDVTTKLWPSEEDLLAWVRAHIPDAIRTKLEPDKRLIGEHIKSSGDVPDGYSEVTDTRLYIK